MSLWNKKDDPELPPELKDKSPQEILAMLNEAKETKTRLDALAAEKTTTDGELATIKTQLAENATLIEQLKANQKDPPPPKTDDPPNPWLDPDKWVAGKMEPAMMTAMYGAFMSCKMLVKEQLDDDDKRIFKKYEKEIDQAMQGYPPQARIIPDNWMSALNIVKGRHLKEIAKMFESGGEFFSEGSHTGRHEEPTPETKLTPEEEAACKAMHWDPKTYLENRAKMSMVRTEKGSLARFTNE